MPNDIVIPDPGQYGLTSFADLLGTREPIIGENTIPFVEFHQALLADFKPRTAYEAVVAESLVDIEWQLYQQRRMRDTFARDKIRNAVVKAVVKREERNFDRRYYQARDEWCEAGNKSDEFEFEAYDGKAANELGHDLARRLVDFNPAVRSGAEAELIALGLDVVALMAETHQQENLSMSRYTDRIDDLERRRRQVKADFDMLVSVRPRQPSVIDA